MTDDELLSRLEGAYSTVFERSLAHAAAARLRELIAEKSDAITWMMWKQRAETAERERDKFALLLGERLSIDMNADFNDMTAAIADWTRRASQAYPFANYVRPADAALAPGCTCGKPRVSFHERGCALAPERAREPRCSCSRTGFGTNGCPVHDPNFVG